MHTSAGMLSYCGSTRGSRRRSPSTSQCGDGLLLLRCFDSRCVIAHSVCPICRLEPEVENAAAADGGEDTSNVTSLQSATVDPVSDPNCIPHSTATTAALPGCDGCVIMGDPSGDGGDMLSAWAGSP